MSIQFTVHGKPSTAGSKRGIPYPKKGGGTGVRMIADDPKALLWRNAVAYAAHEAYDGPLLTGPVELHVDIQFPRPKSHFGQGRNSDKLKPSSPYQHIQKPDLSKLVRAIEDSLKGVIWRDDSQVIGQAASKWWGDKYETQVVIVPRGPSNCGSSAEDRKE